MLFVIGILDDAGFLHPQIKLMVAMPIAAMVLIYFDMGLKNFTCRIFKLFFHPFLDRRDYGCL